MYRSADCHVHLSLWEEVSEPFLAMKSAGILPVGVSCDLEDSRRNVHEAQKLGYPCMIGIHPWYAQSAVFDEAAFSELAQSAQVAGFGECGLDTEGCALALSDQQKLLCDELEFAVSRKLPLNLHVRHAHSELIKILRSFKVRLCGGCVHNFTFSKEIARCYLDLGLFLSVGHHVLQQSGRMRQALRYAGISQILTETDYDGVHTGSYDQTLIDREINSIAQILDLNPDKTAAALYDNARRFLKKKPS